MPHRPLALISGLTVGDYLLWNWSLNANHEVIALVSGLTLPPLALAALWLLVLALGRLFAAGADRRRRLAATHARAASPALDAESAREAAARPARSGKLAA